MRIVVRQVSGLGNQLFQYAAGRYYARQHGAKLRVAIEPAHRAISHGVFPRPFQLSRFCIKAPVSPFSRLDRLFLSEQRGITFPLDAIKKTLGVASFTESADQRYRFLRALPIESGVRKLYLFGYWQAYGIVKQVEQELRVEFALKEPATGRNHMLQEQIRAAPNPVSLHIRRGDYALPIEGRIALPDSYYTRAISLIQEKIHDPTFFIFSDDMEYAKGHLPKGIRKVFVEQNDDFSSQEDLRLMSCCRHHIIANSTFSWWGAWLNGRPEKTVIAPRHWLLREDSYFPELLPPDWMLLDTLREPGEQ